MSFLDLEIYKNKNLEFHTRLFFKATDVHAYLAPHSCQPRDITENTPYGVAFRARRACSEMSEFVKVTKLFVDIFFPRRGYCRHTVRDAFAKVAQLTYADILVKKEKIRERRFTPFIFALDPKMDIPGKLRTCAVQARA